MKIELIAVVTTVEKVEDAQRIAKKAVESRLAACAQRILDRARITE
jgi:uncharacterized protein involved in tolerance to divalent cations